MSNYGVSATNGPGWDSCSSITILPLLVLVVIYYLAGRMTNFCSAGVTTCATITVYVLDLNVAVSGGFSHFCLYNAGATAVNRTTIGMNSVCMFHYYWDTAVCNHHLV